MATDFDEQYEALQRGCGVVELVAWSSVTVTGADRQQFLHNFCTNEVNSLAPGDHCEAFFTNAKGKMIAHGLISCRQSELTFLGTPNQAPRLIEHLDRYIIREDVQLRDTMAERKFLLITGAASAREPLAASAALLSWSLVGGDDVGILELPSNELAGMLHKLVERGCVVAGWPAFTAARIEAGMPLFGVDFDEHSLPQEINRDREAISFTKGCYLGQETVARIDALGHVNQKIVGVRFFVATVPPAGEELLKAGEKVGRVTSATFSPRLDSSLALAIVRREANSSGTRLESAIGDCEVIPLPVTSAMA